MTRGELRDICKRALENISAKHAEMITDAEWNSIINEGLIDTARGIEGELVTTDLSPIAGRYWLPPDFLELKRVDQPTVGLRATLVDMRDLTGLDLAPVPDFTPALPANIGTGWSCDFNQGYLVGLIGEKLADHGLIYNDADQLYHLVHISERYYLDPVYGSATQSGREFGHQTSPDLRTWTKEDDVLAINYDSNEWNDMAHWAPNMHVNPTAQSKFVAHFAGIGGRPTTGTAARSDPEKIGAAYSNDLYTWWYEDTNPVCWGGIGRGNLVSQPTLPVDLQGGWGADMVYHGGKSWVCDTTHLSQTGVAEPGVAGTQWGELPGGGGNPANLPAWANGVNYNTHYQFFWPWYQWLAVTRDPSIFYDPGTRKYYMLTTGIGPADSTYGVKGFLAIYECIDSDAGLITWQDMVSPLIEFQDHTMNIESAHILPITHATIGRTYHLFWSAGGSVIDYSGTPTEYVAAKEGGVWYRYLCEIASIGVDPTDPANRIDYWTRSSLGNRRVNHLGSSYACKLAHDGRDSRMPPSGTYWVNIPNDAAYPAWFGGDKVQQGGTAYQCIASHINQVPPNATYWVSLGAAAGEPAWNAGTYYYKGTAYSVSMTTYDPAVWYEPSGSHHQSNALLFDVWGGAGVGETAGCGKHVTGKRGETAGEATEVPAGIVFSCHRIFYNGGGVGANDRYYYRFGWLDFDAISSAGYDPAVATQHPVYTPLDGMGGIVGGWKVLTAGTIPSEAFDFQPTWGDQPSLDINRGNIPAGISGNSYVNTFEGYQAPGRGKNDEQAGWSGNHQLMRGPDYGYGDGDPYASCDVRGVAISEAFTITRNRIKVKVAGGNRPIDTGDADFGRPCVICLVRRSDHNIIFMETGKGVDTTLNGDHWILTTRLWDTSTLVGEAVYCAIVDLCDSIGNTALNGHIACDLIEEYGEPGVDDDTLPFSTPSTVMSLQDLVDHFGYVGSLDNEF